MSQTIQGGKKMNTTYRKLVVDDLVVKVWRGKAAKDVFKKIGLLGIAMEFATKDEYLSDKEDITKVVKPKEQLTLWG